MRWAGRRRSMPLRKRAGSELNVWVVVQPDERCVIRIARSEMGQGTLTGLAQLVAEELECDWSKVRTEQISPQQNFAAKRAWGEMGTGGSRGIRTSHDYVRRGGAAARLMLLQAAADEWKVPVAELKVANGVITHAAVEPQHHLRQGRCSGRQADAARSQGDHAEGPEDLEGRGPAAEAPGHRRQARRQQAVRDRRARARHAQRGDQGVPGVRRQAGQFRQRRDRQAAGRQGRGARQRPHRGGGGRHLVARQDRARRAADSVGRRRRRQRRPAR